MYQFNVDEQTTKKVKQQAEQSKSILEKFQEVDDNYKIRSDKQELNLKELEYEKPSIEQVESSAKSSLESYKNNSLQGIEDSFKTKSEQIDQSVKQANQEKQQKQATIQNTYEKVKEDASNDAIKRGLARSSIIVNKLSEYDNSMLDDLKELSNKTDAQIKTLTDEKASLEQEKLNALNSFNIEYAVKLQDKINSLNETILKEEQEVIKYNNQIAEKQAEFDAEQDEKHYKQIMDFAERYERGLIGINMMKQEEKYEIAKEHFSAMDKAQALAELASNPIYKENLGNSYYNKLLKQLQG